MRHRGTRAARQVWSFEMKTLDDIFPGNTGRMKKIRVALRLKMPDLMKMDGTKPLDKALSKKLENAMLEIERG